MNMEELFSIYMYQNITKWTTEHKHMRDYNPVLYDKEFEEYKLELIKAFEQKYYQIL